MLVSLENGAHRDTDTHSPFFRRHRRKPLATLLWLALLGGYQLYAWKARLAPL